MVWAPPPPPRRALPLAVVACVLGVGSVVLMAIGVVTAYLMPLLCLFAVIAGMALTVPALNIGIVAIPMVRHHAASSTGQRSQ